MTSKVFTSYRLGPFILRNRMVKSATFENLAPGGRVSDELIQFHKRIAEGGVGMTTVAYIAVEPGGRTYEDQLVIDGDSVNGLHRLTDAVHDQGANACAQIGHAGWFATPSVIKATPMGPSRTFSPRAMQRSRAATLEDLHRLFDAFERAGALAVEAGFDCVEVHLGHGYLLSQFLSPYTNKRRDAYGGSVVGRARFPREAVAAVRRGVGDRAAVTAKLNMFDGFRGGLNVDDAITVARLLESDGNLDAIQLTCGFTARTPMALLRGDSPVQELANLEDKASMRLAMKAFAGIFMRSEPFEEAFLLPTARKFRRALTMPLMLLGGITKLETMEQAIDEGFDLVALGRALLYDPDFPRRCRQEVGHQSGCIHCNRCIVEMERSGAKCVLEDAPGFGQLGVRTS